LTYKTLFRILKPRKSKFLSNNQVFLLATFYEGSVDGKTPDPFLEREVVFFYCECLNWKLKE
jgi:hypothetical protein